MNNKKVATDATIWVGSEIIVIDCNENEEEVSCYVSHSLLAQKSSSGIRALVTIKKEQLYSSEGLTEEDFNYDPMANYDPDQSVLICTYTNAHALSNTNLSQNTPSAMSESCGSLPFQCQSSLIDTGENVVNNGSRRFVDP
jgi:hypothetical protein